MKIRQDPEQLKIAQQIHDAFNEGVVDIFLEAPTGYGKSGIAYFAHNLTGYSTAVLSHQKILLDQYDNLLRNYACTVKGKANYPCAIDGDVTVDQALCQFGYSCRDKENCEYFVQRTLAPRAKFLNTTYQLVLSLLDTAVGFDLNKDLYIFDECHNLPAIFTDYRSVRLGSQDLVNYTRMEAVCEKDPELLEVWESVEYAAHCIEEIDFNRIDESNFEEPFAKAFKAKAELVALLEAKINKFGKSYDRDDRWIAKKLAQLHSFDSKSCCKHSNMQSFYGSVLENKEFVIEKKSFKDTWELQVIPLKVNTMFPMVANTLAPRRIFMSATIFGVNRLRRELGLTKPFKFIGMPSKFDVENRRVYSIPVLNMNHTTISTGDLTPMYDSIQDICEMHLKEGDSGIIFTPSYNLSKMILDRIGSSLERVGAIMLANTSGADRDDVLNIFRDERIKKPKILISPSFFEGVNFENDYSRFQIISKVPFLSLGSKYVKTKMQLDQTWYSMEAIKSIVQASGRSVRNESDYAMTYILDSNFNRVFGAYSQYVPQWFKDALLIKRG